MSELIHVNQWLCSTQVHEWKDVEALIAKLASFRPSLQLLSVDIRLKIFDYAILKHDGCDKYMENLYTMIAIFSRSELDYLLFSMYKIRFSHLSRVFCTVRSVCAKIDSLVAASRDSPDDRIAHTFYIKCNPQFYNSLYCDSGLGCFVCVIERNDKRHFQCIKNRELVNVLRMVIMRNIKSVNLCMHECIMYKFLRNGNPLFPDHVNTGIYIGGKFVPIWHLRKKYGSQKVIFIKSNKRTRAKTIDGLEMFRKTCKGI